MGMKTGKPIGRPPLDPKKRRSVLVAFRLTKRETRTLRAAARAARLSISAFIVGRCLDGR